MVRLKFLIARTMEKLSAMNTTFKFRLLDLPNELIAHIIEFVEDRNALRRLACTCHRLQYLAEPVLYRSFSFRSGARAQRLLHSLIARVERSSALQVLQLPLDISYMQNFSVVTGLLKKAQNLRELMIESPACNSADFENYERWMRMTDAFFEPFQSYRSLKRGNSLGGPSLQKLTKLTLHLNGPRSPYWTIDSRSLNILLHPTLRELKLSCVNILDNIVDDVDLERVTPLKILTLEECNVTHKGLSGLLSLPKALEELHLGENCHNLRHFSFAEIDPKSGYLFARDPAAAIVALSQQQDSLRVFTYTTTDVIFTTIHLLRARNITRGIPVDGGFADFHHLENVSLIGDCALFERALISTRSPPNLRHLTFASVSPFRNSAGGGTHPSATPAEGDTALLTYVPFLRTPSASIPKNLQTLDVVIEMSEYATPEWSLVDGFKAHVEKAAKAAAKTSGLKLRLLERRHGQYYPPFLWGEQEPEAKLMFDGDQFVNESAWEDVDSDSYVSEYETDDGD